MHTPLQYNTHSTGTGSLLVVEWVGEVSFESAVSEVGDPCRQLLETFLFAEEV